MVRRKRKIVRFPRKQIPKIFSCPKCGVTAVRVVIVKEKQMATVNCGKCNLNAEFPTAPVDQAIDIYCKFTDKFNVGELK
jgi:transcription elongation factor Elf1